MNESITLTTSEIMTLLQARRECMKQAENGNELATIASDRIEDLLFSAHIVEDSDSTNEADPVAKAIEICDRHNLFGAGDALLEAFAPEDEDEEEYIVIPM